MVVVGVDDDALHHNLGVYHDELQLMFAWSDFFEVYFQPADIVEDLITAQLLASILPTTKQQVVVWRQGLQLFRLCKVLGCVFAKFVVQSLTGIDSVLPSHCILYTPCCTRKMAFCSA